MPEIMELVPKVQALEYDGTNADEAGSFYKGYQKVVMTGVDPDELWMRTGPELYNAIVGPFLIGTVFIRNDENDTQYKPSNTVGANKRYMAVSPTGELVAPFEDEPMP